MLDEYAAAVRRVAADEGVPLVDTQRLFESLHARGGASVSELLTDGVHPNDRAYRMLADALAPVLVERIAWGRTRGGSRLR